MRKIYIISILVLALGLRLINLDQSFWLDEASQAQMASMTLAQIWHARDADFHPPLFYMLSHAWVQINTSESWLRTLPVIFGVANIWVMYLFFKNRIGLMAAFLLAINPFHIYYSQEFRSYSLLAFLGTLSMYFLFKKKYLWMALINTLLLYTHYSGFLLVMTQFIFAPITMYYSLLTLILYLPWAPQFLHQLRSGINIDDYLPGWRQVLTVSPLKAVPLTIFKFIAGRINLVSKIMYGVYAGIVLATTGITMVLAKTDRQFLWRWAASPLILSLALSLVVPQTLPFRLIFILPAVLLLVAQGCMRYPKLLVALFVYFAVFGNVLYFTRPRLQREQWRQAIEYINSHPAPAIVAFSDKFAPMMWYQTNFQVIPAVPSFPAKPQEVTEKLLVLPNKIYYFDYLSDLTDPNRLVRLTLENLGYVLVATHDFSGVGFVFEYQKT